MKEAFMLMIVCLVPISLFGMAAFLIYRKSDGWGWFLLVVLLICGSVNYKYTPDNGEKAESREAH